MVTAKALYETAIIYLYAEKIIKWWFVVYWWWLCRKVLVYLENPYEKFERQFLSLKSLQKGCCTLRRNSDVAQSTFLRMFNPMLMLKKTLWDNSKIEQASSAAHDDLLTCIASLCKTALFWTAAISPTARPMSRLMRRMGTIRMNTIRRMSVGIGKWNVAGLLSTRGWRNVSTYPISPSNMFATLTIDSGGVWNPLSACNDRTHLFKHCRIERMRFRKLLEFSSQSMDIVRIKHVSVSAYFQDETTATEPLMSHFLGGNKIFLIVLEAVLPDTTAISNKPLSLIKVQAKIQEAEQRFEGITTSHDFNQ